MDVELEGITNVENFYFNFGIRDVYAIAQLVGESGKVIGVDMTDEQLATANEFEEYHREKFGYAKSNVSFKTFIHRICYQITNSPSKAQLESSI